MSYPQYEGTYVATIGQHAIGELNDKAIFNCQYMLESLDGFPDVVCQGQYVSEKFFLEKNDGGLNLATIDSLKEAFNWDGQDIFWLEDSDFTGHKVRVVVVSEPGYNDPTKTFWRVSFVNPLEGGSGGAAPIEGSNQALRAKLTQRMGSRLRANSGGGAGVPARTAPAAPAAAVTPPAGHVGGPPPIATPTPVGPGAPPAAADNGTCWTLLCQAMNGVQQSDIDAAWCELIGAAAPGKQPADVTPAEWAAVAQSITSKFPGVA